MTAIPSGGPGLSTAPAAAMLVVFLLSRRCNLQCTYCNVEAGPHVTEPQLSLAQVDAWVRAFCSLGQVELSVQLHGGEPLLVTPPAEIYAAVVRNAVAAFPNARLVDIGLQTNGLLLDGRRHAQLQRAHLRAHVSLDGPAHAHDRYRVTAGHKPSFKLARRAAQLLRDRGANDDVIAVITNPADVLPAVRFFIAEGFRGARMSPVRPEGRGVLLTPTQERDFMHAMAVEYAAAARQIAAHNLATPAAAFYETGMATLMREALAPAAPPPDGGWVFMVDDFDGLWAHPGGYGIPSLHLVAPGADKAAGLAAALTPRTPAAAEGLVARMAARHRELFSTCAACSTPDYCRSFAGYAAERRRGEDPLCTWRRELVADFREWAARDPVSARALLRPVRSSPRAPAPELAPGGARDDAEKEPMRPAVRAILDAVETAGDNAAWIDDYPHWVGVVQQLDPVEQQRACVQLAVLSRQMRAAGARDLADALVALAHLGLDPVDFATTPTATVAPVSGFIPFSQPLTYTEPFHGVEASR